jgi:hypothetical protein
MFEFCHMDSYTWAGKVRNCTSMAGVVDKTVTTCDMLYFPYHVAYWF